MFSVTYAKAKILNALLPRVSSDITLYDYAFTNDISPSIALSINAMSSSFAVKPYSFDFLKYFPELSAYSPTDIPGEILAAAFEKTISSYLKILGDHLDAQISVVDFIDKEQLNNYVHKIDISIKLNDIGELPLRVFAKDDNALKAFLERVNILPLINAPLQDIDLKLNLNIGATRLNADEIKSLRVGDALIFDNDLIKNNRVMVCFKNYRALADLNDETKTVVLLSALEENDIQVNTEMSEQKEITKINDIDLKLNFSLDSINLKLSEIQQLTQGSIINLSNTTLDNIAICVEGKCIGYGKVIEIGDKTALQITRI